MKQYGRSKIHFKRFIQPYKTGNHVILCKRSPANTGRSATRNPLLNQLVPYLCGNNVWIPACAGMTAREVFQKFHFIFFNIIFCFLFNMISVISFAADTPFTNANNWGATGLMEMPTARVLETGKYRVGVSQINPYRYYYMAISPIKGLEIDGRVTEALDVPANPDSPTWKDYGNNKDKSIDLKYQFIAEGKYWPAMTLGIMDPHGTRKYGGQYIALSKQIYPFDLTIGMGNGRFGKQPLAASDREFNVEMFTSPRQWLSDAQLFGGIEFSPTPEFTLMIEYNPIKYEVQVGDMVQKKYFTEAVPSKINFGARYKPWDWAEIAVSYQRGNQVGVNLSFDFNLEKPLQPIFDLPYKEKKEEAANPLAERISKGLYASGFSDIGVKRVDNEIWVQATNEKYLFSARALGVMLKVLDQILPRDIEKVNIYLTDRGIPVIAFTTARDDLALFEEETLKIGDYWPLAELNTNVYELPEMSPKHKQYFFWGVKPEIHSLLNDPSGFFKVRAGASAWASVQPWKGASFITGVEAYPLNNVSTTNEPLSIPVRSDCVAYQKKDMMLSSVMFEQIGKTKYEIYGKIAAGLLEYQYGGVDTEIAKPLFDGRVFTGVSGSVVKKRDTANPLKFNNNDLNDNYTAAFLNTRLNLPEVEMALDVKAGRFLAGDKGARVTLSKYFNGVTLSAWYSFTDTSVFSDSYNNGYHDKGVAISIPLRMFIGKDTRTVYDYSLSPWTRDVAQDISHRTSLFDFIGRNTKRYLDKDSYMMQ